MSYTTLTDAISDLLYASATYYSYDIHGNVDTLLQHYGKGVLQDIDGHSFKRIEYNYDLISGKVNEVAYQPGVTDQFYHRYVYDAENRLTQVYTSADREHWEKQAGYSYYRHGPLARTELGQLMVQGIDYAYTLQGWLKGVNSNAIGSSFDMGADGLGLSRPTRDAYSFSLQYNAGDYKAVSTNKYPFVKVDYLAPVTDAQPVGRGLYNGNISSMLVNIPKLGDAHLYGYSYDQLNRLTAMNAYTGLNAGNNSFVPSGTTHYRERVSYDGNGNILSYLRNGEGANTSMDNLGYAYNLSGGWLQNNKLRHVTDAVTTTPTGYGDLKNGQANDNYGYDAIGNLVKDESEGIASGGIEWNVYGKISQITKTNSGVTTVIKYTYDATGNRIGKWVQVGAGTPKQTAYVRDASGNVMAIYEKGNSEVNGGLLSQIEVPLYGSSRLGVWRPDREVETTGWELFDTDPMTGTGGGIAGGWERGRVQFELSNHLGNVLVTISDARTAVDDGTYEVFTICHTCLPGIPCVPCFNEYDKQNSTPDGVVDYYLPQVLTANDYYPFGMGMPGRKFAEDDLYRYGFNGKENDNDVKGEGNQQDYGMRIYDPRSSKFLSVDPLTTKYPELTPYQFASNSPIQGVDLDGLELLPRFKQSSPFSLTTHAFTRTIEKTTAYQILKGAGSGMATSMQKTLHSVRHPVETLHGALQFTEEVIIGSAPGVKYETPIIDSRIKDFQDNFINGNAYTRSKYLMGAGTDLAIGYFLTKGVGEVKTLVVAKYMSGTFRIGPKTLAIVTEHLEQFGVHAENTIMLERMKKIANKEMKATEIDINFAKHELRESELMKDGLSPDKAHEKVLKEQGMYHKDYEKKLYTEEALKVGNEQMAKESANK